MRTVEDESGSRYVLLKQSTDGWLVRDPETGNETYRSPDSLTIVEGQSPLAVAATAVPESVRVVLSVVHAERDLGLLLELARDGPLSVRTLLDRYEYCESDLHGRLAEFRVAGLIVEERVAGERGYATTPDAEEATELLTGEQFVADSN
ncbi:MULTISPECIES: hypothetical protein [unclassified Halorhabdus]|uniref:DUF7346 family protein n=1 Tax=unclassified Halorhabdus TaxID=2621901 RepID=UPI0023DB637F|nr:MULTISPECIES: hypothetical protein [unclassified Halorhabdus]WEL17382.1 Transcriptional regulator, HTH domain [Halorhabdus sp. SVX81]WEL21258.1 Transcriptional regulator, HTH domain [Halorhabdus sp. BNX81]